jgi:hypothetical protein
VVGTEVDVGHRLQREGGLVPALSRMSFDEVGKLYFEVLCFWELGGVYAGSADDLSAAAEDEPPPPIGEPFEVEVRLAERPATVLSPRPPQSDHEP